MTGNIRDGVMRAILKRNQREDEEEFQHWCEELLSLPANLELVPKENFKADIELQPLRWMALAMDLLKSRRVTGHVELTDGVQGPETGSYLPYPVSMRRQKFFLRACGFASIPTAAR